MREKLLCIVLLWASVPLVESVPTVGEINKLTRKLLQDYDKNTLPSSDFTKQFVVNITAYPLAVGNVDEVEEELATVLGFSMTWIDASIQWDPDDHSNITNITLGFDEVWKPNFMLLNPHQKDIKGHLDMSSSGISFTHLGQTTWTTMVTLHTTCDLETTNFPFDVQYCMIKLFIAGNDMYNIIINGSWRNQPLKENGAWKIKHNVIAGSSVSSFNIGFKFERKPMFILLNVLLPIIILAMLTPLVFMLPQSSGERLGYSVTMLLSISVYMTIVSDYLPKNSDPMPLISIMMFVWYILNAVIVLIVIVNIKISSIKDSHSIPGCFRALVRLTRRITSKSCRKIIPGCACALVRLTRSITKCCRKNEKCRQTNDEGVNEKGPNENDVGVKETCLNENDEGVNETCLNENDEHVNENDCQDESMRITWMEVSAAIDKWCIVTIYLIKFVLLAVFFVKMSSSD